MIKIGEYIEMAVEWLTEHGASFFDLLSLGVEGVIDGILCILLEIPFYITIVTLTFLALYKSGRETGGFTLLGLSLVYGMGLWERPCRPWLWYFPPPVWHCCWESLWGSGWRAADAATKSCSRYLIVCRLCRPLSI